MKKVYIILSNQISKIKMMLLIKSIEIYKEHHFSPESSRKIHIYSTSINKNKETINTSML
jgi:hypothetical protein